jgi:hypothetical protein
MFTENRLRRPFLSGIANTSFAGPVASSSFTFDVYSMRNLPPLSLCQLPILRTLLPALTDFQFRGCNEYLKGLVARIDSPHLTTASILCLDQPVNLQVVHLVFSRAPNILTQVPRVRIVVRSIQYHHPRVLPLNIIVLSA